MGTIFFQLATVILLAVIADILRGIRKEIKKLNSKE